MSTEKEIHHEESPDPATPKRPLKEDKLPPNEGQQHAELRRDSKDECDVNDEAGSSDSDSDSDSMPPNIAIVRPLQQIEEKQPILLLSLDGGGIRGLSSILILKHIMNELNKDRKKKLKPCQVFNLIGGTSTGG
jgi:hypothetical protein